MSTTPIQEVGEGNVHQCGNCGEHKGTRTFIVNGDAVVSCCPRCAREVITALSTAFPGDQLPTWFTMMGKLSS